MSEYRKVKSFHKKFGLPAPAVPCWPDEETIALRNALIHEEAEELREAFATQDLVGVADALADLLYVTLGAAVSCGIDLPSIFHEVHRTNMLKDGGGSAANGKILKPEGWEPPDVEGLLRKQGWTP